MGLAFCVEDIVKERIGSETSIWSKRPFLWFLRKLSHEREFAEFDAKYPSLRGLDIVEQILRHLNVRCEIDAFELENIPDKGPVVLVANHPIGSLDGLALLKTVSAVRTDVKIVANQLLAYLEPLKEMFIAVENMRGRASRDQIENARAHLENQGALVIFPAGEVSRVGLKGIRDRRWSGGFVKLAARARSPIVPIHIEGRNSAIFYLLSMIYKPFSTYLLIHEMFVRRRRWLKIHVGERVSYQTWYDSKTPSGEVARRFRRHVYLIGKRRKGCIPSEAPIALPTADRAALKAALEACEELGEAPDGKSIRLYRRAEGTSPILHELGRLREIAFRAVGEGSGRRLDLDKYDDYYNHLILWDPQRLEIVGAYRFFAADRDSIDLLYSKSLFNYGKEMEAIVENGIELGRSFVQPAYWGGRGLDYLLQGIGAYAARNPDRRYLFGPVSISGALPVAARDLLVAFYRLYFAAGQPFAVSKRPYPASLPESLKNFSGNDYEEDFKRLKNILGNMNCGVPTLYKQYSEMCDQGGVQFADFGADPDFNDCIDGLVIVDMSKLKPSRYRRYVAPFVQ
jgi:putative hemolysin